MFIVPRLIQLVILIS